jgi:[ribosomal protein S18]-alanine N-acetyltransferase
VSVEIRTAEAADGPAIAVLEKEAFGSDAWSDALVAEGLGGGIPGALYLVAMVSPRDGSSFASSGTTDEIAGYAAASLFADVSELQRIAVTTSARRGGVASGLLERIEHEARQRYSERLLLEVREDNHAACAFYAARGFTEIDRRARYYADGTTAVVLAKDLNTP